MIYIRPSSRPVLGFSLAYDVSETVAMDLKEFRSVYILPMLHHATSYSAAASSKQNEAIIDKILKHWIAIFGTHNLFRSNNGGEFRKIFREMGEQLNINIRTTAVKPPWSNDIVGERNGVIGDMIEKVMSDVWPSLEVALACCISAKNSLLSSYG